MKNRFMILALAALAISGEMEGMRRGAAAASSSSRSSSTTRNSSSPKGSGSTTQSSTQPDDDLSPTPTATIAVPTDTNAMMAMMQQMQQMQQQMQQQFQQQIDRLQAENAQLRLQAASTSSAASSSSTVIVSTGDPDEPEENINVEQFAGDLFALISRVGTEQTTGAENTQIKVLLEELNKNKNAALRVFSLLATDDRFKDKNDNSFFALAAEIGAYGIVKRAITVMNTIKNFDLLLATNKDNTSALHLAARDLACYNGNVKTVGAILASLKSQKQDDFINALSELGTGKKRGAEIDTSKALTALDMAIRNGFRNGTNSEELKGDAARRTKQLQVINLLIGAGAEQNATNPIKQGEQRELDAVGTSGSAAAPARATASGSATTKGSTSSDASTGRPAPARRR